MRCAEDVYALAIPKCLLLLIPAVLAVPNDFVRVRNAQLVIGKSPFYFVGANYWQCANLGSTGVGGDVVRLQRELDVLAANGVRQLRVMGASEGPDSELYRIVPSLQPAPGVMMCCFWSIYAEISACFLSILLFLMLKWITRYHWIYIVIDRR